MQDIMLDYGDTRLGVALPDSATIVRYGRTYTDPAGVDPLAATREALASPGGLPPLAELAGPDKTAAIAFPDRVKGGSHPGFPNKPAARGLRVGRGVAAAHLGAGFPACRADGAGFSGSAQRSTPSDSISA